VRLLVPLLLLACVRPNGDTPGSGEWVAPPRIVEVMASCDVARQQWTFDTATDAWAGGGQVYLAIEATWVEAHSARSIAAAEDGSSDLLRAVTSLVEDYRDARDGGGTRFECNDVPPAMVFSVFAQDGGVADCVRVPGRRPPEFWDRIEGIPPGCDAVMELTPVE